MNPGGPPPPPLPRGPSTLPPPPLPPTNPAVSMMSPQLPSCAIGVSPSNDPQQQRIN